jgi:predicted porin
MNKKLIAVALAALPVAAMADVTLYGSLNAGLEHDTATNAASNSGVHDYTSIIGFKGTEDLGNGLKTVWQVENRVVIGGDSKTYGGSSNQLASRQSFVGLDGGNLGQVRIGLINSSLKDLYNVDQWQYDGEMSNYKQTSSTSSYNSGVNGLAVMTNQASRLKNAIRYDSATFYGFSANAVYGFGENKTTSVTKASDIASVGLNYSISDFNFHYAYQKEFNPSNGTNANLTSSSPNSAHINYFEAGYNANNLYVGLAYQDMVGYDWTDEFAGDSNGSTGTALTNQLKSREAALSVAYTIGAFTPKFTYAKGWDQEQGGSSISNTGYQQYVVGVDYALSKRTTAEFAYGRLKADSASSLAVNGADTTYSTLALSMMHNF